MKKTFLEQIIPTGQSTAFFPLAYFTLVAEDHSAVKHYRKEAECPYYRAKKYTVIHFHKPISRIFSFEDE